MTLFVAIALCCAQAWAVPRIQHSPVTVAERGKAISVRATVTDASARVSSVQLFYALSRGSTPFRSDMTASGAGLWFGTIPGHLVGPGTELLYYVQAENADGETAETDWQTVRVVAPASSPAPANIPSATAVGNRAQATALPAQPAVQRGVGTVPSRAPKVDNSKKYWITAGIIAGGALAVGGAIALSDSGGGGSKDKGGSGSVSNANFRGNYILSFHPNATSNSVSSVDASDTHSGNANIYVKNGSVEVVGIWGSEILTGTLSGNYFRASKSVPASGSFPAARLTVSGSISGSTCHAEVDGTSLNTSRPGIFDGSFDGSSHR